MNRHLVSVGLAAAVSMAASSAHAHHSHPYFYDQCKTVTVEGRVDSVQWKNPHTLVVLTRDDGAAFTIDWNALNGLTRSGVIDPAKVALVFGARIEVTGNPIRTAAQIREHFPEYTGQGNPNVIDPIVIRRADNSWRWARSQPQNPPGCDAGD